MVLPLDGAGPAAVVTLAEDHHIAVTVPCEATFVEDELDPTRRSGLVQGARIHLGHARSQRRSGRNLGVGHIGHPNGDVLLVLADAVGCIPAQTRERSSRHASLFKLGGSEELGSDAIVIQGVEGEVTRGAGAFTNLSLKRSTGSATASGSKASVVVGGHGAAFAVEVLGIEGNLSVLEKILCIITHKSADDGIVLNRELVDTILAFRNLGERQGVVVVKHGGRNLGRST